MARPASDVRDRSIAAALRLTSTSGAGSLTMEAVAREAGVSKGGVLHHFRSKDALLLAMVERLVETFEEATKAKALADENPIGRFTRAFIDVMTTPELADVGRPLLAVVAENPELLAPLRASFHRCFVLLEGDGIDPVDAHVAALAVDAMWLNAVLGLPSRPPALHAAIVERLRVLTESTATGRAPRASAPRTTSAPKAKRPTRSR
ncbi:MAG: TetR/AcrR family transcriptional regulator [Polyangiaceae bacterium]